jgi:hypothetical protein
VAKPLSAKTEERPSMMMCWIEADRGDRGRGVSVLVVSDGFK